MSLSVTAAAEVFRQALRDSVRRHSFWYLVQGVILIAAGVLLVAAAVATLWYELRPRRPVAVDAADHGDHGHSHREPAVAWLLVLPVFALLLVGSVPLPSAVRSGHGGQDQTDPTAARAAR